MIIQANFIDGFKPNSYGKLIVKLKSPVNTTVDISREKAQALKNGYSKMIEFILL